MIMEHNLNRTRKFRLWHPIQKRMIFNVPLKGVIVPELQVSGYENYPLMQWIGEDDIFGNPAYEGDIIEDTEDKKHFVVEWCQESLEFYFRSVDTQENRIFMDYKIVGNIFEGVKK